MQQLNKEMEALDSQLSEINTLEGRIREIEPQEASVAAHSAEAQKKQLELQRIDGEHRRSRYSCGDAILRGVLQTRKENGTSGVVTGCPRQVMFGDTLSWPTVFVAAEPESRMVEFVAVEEM